MWITADVNLPPEVVAAHADGELVLFVGAGASMDPPSNLPSFTQLAKDLAEAARVPFDGAKPLDTFLGFIPPNFDVHGHARDQIARPESRFNETHSALIEVAAATGMFRLVTTNFDDHLAGAAEAEDIDITDRWTGPALPLGHDFKGLVHLHGSVLRPASELVLTDSDFGRAYLTDAWATRLLQRMFEHFTVLFVGYSHDDPIMRYLSLGLPSKTRRYVIHHHADDEKWHHLGITAIGYPAPDNDHIALVDALRAWATRARMGRLEHRALMEDIIEGGPSSMTPVDEDYVDERLHSVDGARDFAQLARTIDWLRWMEGRDEAGRRPRSLSRCRRAWRSTRVRWRRKMLMKGVHAHSCEPGTRAARCQSARPVQSPLASARTRSRSSTGSSS